MIKDTMLTELESVREFFLRAIRPLEEKDSAFVPTPGSYSVAAQIAHVAWTIEWFREGAFGKGFDMNFAEHDRLARECTSVKAGIALFNKHMDAMKATVASRTEAQLQEHFADNPIIKGPKWTMLVGIADHTAHHRGSLAVYTRLLGKTPQMPYADM